jgi:acetaldehyde dehydrogenase
MSTSAAIIGSGAIGTDLMLKAVQLSKELKVTVVAGTGADLDGLARARQLGITTTHEGADGLAALAEFEDVQIVFDTTTAAEHWHNAEVARQYGKRMIDLTSAGTGRQVVPAVNLERHLQADTVTMVNFGVQATVPIVSAVTSVVPVAYAEVVSSIAARSAGPAARAGIDEFIQATATAVEVLGGAGRGKAIAVLNPAEPPVTMRNTVFCLIGHGTDAAGSEERIQAAVSDVATRVTQYVPGYRLKQDVQFEQVTEPWVPALGRPFSGTKATVFLEVSGAGHHLPQYAGNLDIMTSAALRTAERLADPGAKERA